jgi:hypothetical protein
MSQPAISKHLKVLEGAGLISRGRDAQRRPCKLEAEPLAEATGWLIEYRRYWEASFERIVSAEVFDEDWTGGETVSTIVLNEVNAQTTLINTIVYSSKEARDGALATPMAEGMEMSFSNLDLLLEQGFDPSPA